MLQLGRLPNNGVAQEFKVGVSPLTHWDQTRQIRACLHEAEAETSIERVLDCPSGGGRFMPLFAGRTITAVDIDPWRVKNLRKLFPQATVVQDSVFELSFQDQAFDLSLCALLLQHLPPSAWQNALAELARVTRDWLIVTYSNHNALAERARRRMNNVPDKRDNAISFAEFKHIAESAGWQYRARYKTLLGVAATEVVLLRRV